MTFENPSFLLLCFLLYGLFDVSEFGLAPHPSFNNKHILPRSLFKVYIISTLQYFYNSMEFTEVLPINRNWSLFLFSF